VHDNDVDVTPLFSLENADPGGSGPLCSDGEDCDGVDRGVTHARLYDDARSDNDDDDSADILEAILGHAGQREDTGYDNDRVDASVGVGVGAVVGVGVNGQGVSLGVGQGVSLGVGLGVGLVVAPPPLTWLDT